MLDMQLLRNEKRAVRELLDSLRDRKCAGVDSVDIDYLIQLAVVLENTLDRHIEREVHVALVVDDIKSSIPTWR